MKQNPTIGRLTLICVETAKGINTGVIYTQDDLKRAKPAKLLLQCRHCGKSHIFNFSDARLRPIGAEARSGEAARVQRRIARQIRASRA
jgi:hypothetical protein